MSAISTFDNTLYYQLLERSDIDKTLVYYQTFMFYYH